MPFKKLTYKKAGVDISAGQKAVEKIKTLVKKTHDKNVMTGLGTFGSLYNLHDFFKEYKNPVLVQSIDSVGTKVMVGKLMKQFDTLGEDMIGHSCNDILCQGAKPITFLDYLAVNKLKPNQMAEIVKGLAKGCKENEMSLVGGEMAELPGVYQPGEFDIVGSITGIVEKDKIIDGSKINIGDTVIGLGSSGLHTNGFSLARKILFEEMEYKVTDKVKELDGTIGEVLLRPHLSYALPVLRVLEKYSVHGITHITGGGLIENPVRILPKGMNIKLKKGSWPILSIFELLIKHGRLDEHEAYRTFNMGLGMLLVVKREDTDKIMESLSKDKVKVYEAGEVVRGEKKVKLI